MKDRSAVTKAAQKLTQKGQYENAINEWEKLLSGEHDSNVYNSIGDLYLKLKKTDNAVEAFKKAAAAFRKNGFTLKAIAMYTKILNLMPSEVEARIAMAELNADKGLIANAVDHYLAAAECSIREGRKERSLELYKKALKLAPQNTNLKVKVAAIFSEAGLTEEAVKLYEETASGFLNSGDDDRARAFFLKAMSLDPHYVRSLTGLSVIEERAGNLQEALRCTRDALLFAPEDNEAQARFYELTARTGNVDEAADTISALIEKNAANIQLKKMLGSVYFDAGMIEKAWQDLSPAIDDFLDSEKWTEALELLKPFKEADLIEARQKLARAYKNSADKEAALHEFRETARLCREKGDHDGELRSYQEAIELDPGNQEIQESIEALQGVSHSPEETDQVTARETSSGEETGAAISEGVKEKMNEAEFYEHYGLIKESIRVYEELLALSPGDKRLREKILTLQSSLEHEAECGENSNPLQDLCDSSAGSVIGDFREGGEEEARENYETHYEMGFEYIEMGLMEDAIKEFRTASNDPSKKVRCSRVIAQCYMKLEQYQNAIEEFEKLLSELPVESQEYLHIKYDLAEMYEKNSQYDNALRLYQEIQTQDEAFSDVAGKIEAVHSRLEKEKA